MNEMRILQLFLYIFFIEVNCGYRRKIISKTHIPLFRRQVEELNDTLPETDDTHSNLMSLLVNNMKEIFDVTETTETSETEETLLTIERRTRPTITTPMDTNNSYVSMSLTPDDNITEVFITRPRKTTPISLHRTQTRTALMLYKKLPPTTFVYDEDETTESNEIVTEYELSTNDIIKYVTTDQRQREPRPPGNTSEVEAERDPRRSCIMCNNIDAEDCNDPKNRLIQSVMCARDDDMCYSMHTPFGIIDRGCFNSNHNLTTYVCSCNLCNFISISEMPYTFTNKRDWVENVIELSRTKRFRKSVFKDMSCLKCEVNTTIKTGDLLASTNCLEGNIGSIPVEECEQNEVCAVKSLRADGYIWRGCLKAPLYNYWWSMCNYDLCNYDTLISLYDYI